MLNFTCMKSAIHKISRFLLTRTIWMSFLGIWLTGVVLVLQNTQAGWWVFLGYIARLIALFAPVLWYIALRHRLSYQLPRAVMLLLWVFFFVLYPIGVEWLEWHRFVARPGLDLVALRIVTFWFIAVEVAIQGRRWLRRWPRPTRWINRISLEQGIRVLIGLFALQYTALVFFVFDKPALAGATIFTAIGMAAQIFTILMIYYTFYLINHYVLINRLWQQGGIVYYIFGLAATVLILSPIAAQFISWLPMVQTTDIHPAHNGRVFEDIHFIIPSFGMLLSIPLIMVAKWWRQQRELATLARQQSEQELGLLKQQINPHFFFNTLNNLYALSITNDRQTPEVVLQLSDLMRYVIYKGKEATVSLAEEVRYIEDYIRLQQIRLHQHLDLQIEKDVVDEEQRIPPLLFITFVENAFKHGIEPDEGESFLHIYLRATPGEIVFRCENSVSETPQEQAGIGLTNLRRRLEILYPDRHTLEFRRQNQQFTATMTLIGEASLPAENHSQL